MGQRRQILSKKKTSASLISMSMHSLRKLYPCLELQIDAELSKKRLISCSLVVKLSTTKSKHGSYKANSSEVYWRKVAKEAIGN